MDVSELSQAAIEKMGQAISLEGILEVDETLRPHRKIYLQDSEHSPELRARVIGDINEIFQPIWKYKNIKLHYPSILTGTLMKQNDDLCLTNISYAKIILPNKFESVGYKPLPFYLEIRPEYGHFEQIERNYNLKVDWHWEFNANDMVSANNVTYVDVEDVINNHQHYQDQWIGVTGRYEVFRLFVDEADFDNGDDYFFAVNDAPRYETLVAPELWGRRGDSKEFADLQLQNSIFLADTYLDLIADIFLDRFDWGGYPQTITVIGQLIKPWEEPIQYCLGKTQKIIVKETKYRKPQSSL